MFRVWNWNLAKDVREGGALARYKSGRGGWSGLCWSKYIGWEDGWLVQIALGKLNGSVVLLLPFVSLSLLVLSPFLRSGFGSGSLGISFLAVSLDVDDSRPSNHPKSMDKSGW